MNNKKILEKYKKNKILLKVRQIDIDTGKTINIFKNRYQAATWILENGLTDYFYDTVGKTRACIAGSLTNSITNLKNYNSYGYKWEILPENDKSKITYFPIRLKTGIGHNLGTPVVIDRKEGKIKMPSIRAAGAFLSISSDKLDYQLNKYGKFLMDDGTMIKKQRIKSTKGEYEKNLQAVKQEIPVVAKNIITNEMIKFSSMTKASNVFSVHRDTIKNSIKNRKPHKDIQWKLLVK